MNMLKHILLLLLVGIFSPEISWAQEKGTYLFFGGDSLSGFPLKSEYQQAKKELKKEDDIANYLRKREEVYVSRKYFPYLQPKGPGGILTTPCNNLGFETGDTTGWTGATGVTSGATTPLTINGNAFSTLGLNSSETSCSFHTLVNAAAGNDPWGKFPMLDPLAGGGNYSMRLGGENVNRSSAAGGCMAVGGGFTGNAAGELIQQQFVVTPSNALFTYNYAVVLDAAPHSPSQRPYFRAEVLDQNNNPIPCLQFYVESDSTGIPPGMSVSPTRFGTDSVFYLNWSNNSLNLKPYMNQTVTIRFTAAGCTLGGHFGYAYVDAYCSAVELIASSPKVCQGSTVTLTAPGAGTGGTYSWTTIPAGGTGISGSTSGQTVTITTTGTYEVTVYQSANCFYKIDTLITFYPNPSLTLTSTNATCSPGSDGTAHATVSGGNTPYTYQWTPAPGAGQGTATPTKMSAGTYNLLVTTVNGCTTTGKVTITQPSGMTVTKTAANVSCFGKNDGSASVTTSGGGPPITYSWGGGPTTITSTTGSVTGLSAGTYYCTVSDSGGCAITDTLHITQPAQLVVGLKGLPVSCNGKCDGQLIPTVTGGTVGYSYSWSDSSATSNYSHLCLGLYTLQVTDAHGCQASDTAKIGTPPPIVPVIVSSPAHCNRSDGRDSVQVSGGTPGYTYYWSPGPGTSGSVYAFIPAGAYTVIITDGRGCKDTVKNTVTSIPGVLLRPVASSRDTCYGASNGTASVSASGGTPAYSYSWTPAAAIGGGQGTPHATNLAAGAYVCTVTDSNKCTNSVTLTVTQPTPVTLQSLPPAAICYGACATLSASGGGGSPGYSYSWLLNGVSIPSTTVCPLTTTTYTVSCSDTHGCLSVPALVTVVVNPLLEVLTTGSAKICPGKFAQLNATASGGNGGPYTYLWLPASGLSSSTIPNPIATPLVTTTYTVIVSDNCGTPTDSSQETITVAPPPVVNFTSTDTVKCAPVCITFSGTSVPPCASATWTFGDSTQGTGCTTIAHCYKKAGNYPVNYQVIDIDGCSGGTTIIHYVHALPVPVAAFGYSPKPASILDPEISFIDQSTGAILSWNWNFGDLTGASSTSQNPNYTFPDTGCYPVTLIVTGTDACPDTIVHPVCIEPYFTFYAPNTFTPNGDGKNDEWTPLGIGIDPKNYHLMMFDRWGNLMFETYTWGQGWDGRANGGERIAQIDTYVWKVELKDVFHASHQYTGHCNIIR